MVLNFECEFLEPDQEPSDEEVFESITAAVDELRADRAALRKKFSKMTDSRTLALKPTVTLFLDFDGVLRRYCDPQGVFNPYLAPRFEQFLIDYEQVQIVISSSWRLAYALDQLKALFSVSVHDRIIGFTPEAKQLTDSYRYDEISQWLENVNLPWVALDDQPCLFAEN